MRTSFSRSFICFSLCLLLGACDGKVEKEYPVIPDLQRVRERGKLTGDGLTIFDPDGNDKQSGGASPIGVNSFLWRATLDTIDFLPLASADPFGGVILTDWYADPANPRERYKLNILILDKALRADALKVSVFKQIASDTGWQDIATNDGTARKIEDAILTRARELRIQQGS